jgi:hypothetical protein
MTGDGGEVACARAEGGVTGLASTREPRGVARAAASGARSFAVRAENCARNTRAGRSGSCHG